MKSETSDSFVSHFDGHFANLKNFDFDFKYLFCREDLYYRTDYSYFRICSVVRIFIATLTTLTLGFVL